MISKATLKTIGLTLLTLAVVNRVQALAPVKSAING
jgi:hypothetical protein